MWERGKEWGWGKLAQEKGVPSGAQEVMKSCYVINIMSEFSWSSALPQVSSRFDTNRSAVYA
jgi:hypothetical protein